MSLQFCFTETPDIEEMAFQLVALFDAKADAAKYADVEAQIEANIAAIRAEFDALEIRLTEVRKGLMRVTHKLLET